MSPAACSRLLIDAKTEVLAWASHRLGATFREPCFAVGILNSKGRLAGAVIVNDYDARNIEMTMVGPGAFRLHAVRAIFAYAFDELKCRRISVTVPEKNIGTIRLAQKCGWVIEGRKRDYYDNDHAIILGMTRDECRFLKW
jgi:hypothetical protein